MYKMGGREFETDNINEIINFMKLCKGNSSDRFSKGRRKITKVTAPEEVEAIEK